jgi:hypothetical protein
MVGAGFTSHLCRYRQARRGDSIAAGSENPTIARAFGTPLSTIEWGIIGYLVVAASAAASAS